MLRTSSRALRLLVAAIAAALLITGSRSAWAVPLFYEDFEDETLASNAAVANATIAGGFGTFNDESASNRATFSVVQDLSSVETMTFSFDIVAPIVRGEPASFEFILRAGVGTAQNTLSNADHVVESIVYRDGNRGAYLNNGNESIFLVANNSDVNNLEFNSPIDGTLVTLAPLQYIPYVRDNSTGDWGQIKGISNFNGGQRALQRFGIGSSSNGHVGSFAIDNVLVMPGATFEQVPEPASALLAACVLLGLRRRRRS